MEHVGESHWTGWEAQLTNIAPPRLGSRASGFYNRGPGRRRISWKEACSLIGMKPLEVMADYKSGTNSPLSNKTVGGVQMAHVAVDRETGIVKMKKFVAVQDMGLVVSPTQAESQIYGSVIMGIAYALFESRIQPRICRDRWHGEK